MLLLSLMIKGKGFSCVVALAQTVLVQVRVLKSLSGCPDEISSEDLSRLGREPDRVGWGRWRGCVPGSCNCPSVGHIVARAEAGADFTWAHTTCDSLHMCKHACNHLRPHPLVVFGLC